MSVVDHYNYNKEYNMPMGKGTYGSKKGRPAKASKMKKAAMPKKKKPKKKNMYGM